jgi:hypothetical protein
MRADFESYSVNRETAAEICGITDNQLRLWVDRVDLFPEKRKGRGYHTSYDLKDLMKIAAVATLVESTLSVNEACDALRPYTVYSTYLHNMRDLDTGELRADAGEMHLSLTKNGRWIAAWGDDIPMSIVLRTRPLFKKVAGNLLKVIRKNLRSKDDLPVYEAQYGKLMQHGGLS